ncbi:MAG: SH3 domain-containing protein [Proteobacteria bacterium]|nr:SH3 domain-containing protein [Pseudomonadota bacterium]
MRHKRWWMAVVVGSMLVLTLAQAAGAETLYAQRSQVAVRSGPGSYYDVVFTARQGEPLTVVSRRGGWIRVRGRGGTGWVFRTALSTSRGGGASLTRRFLGTSRTSQLDKTAGFKGFNQDTQAAYVSRHRLGAQLQLLDRIKARRISPRAVMGFIIGGRLAR